MLKDLRLQNGDIDLVAGKDMGMVTGQNAVSTLIQTIILGLDKDATHKITDVLNSSSVRKETPAKIADIIQKEIEDRMKSHNIITKFFMGTIVEVDPNKEEIKINVKYLDDDNFVSTVEFSGTLFSDLKTFEFAEPIKHFRW